MKKIFLSIFIIITCLMFKDVYAEDIIIEPDNEDLFSCSYVDSQDSNGYNGQVLYYLQVPFISYGGAFGTEELLDFYAEDLITGANTSNEYGKFLPKTFRANTIAALEEEGFLEDGIWKCPKLAVKSSGENAGALMLANQAIDGDKILIPSLKACPKNGCEYFKIPSYEGTTCIYTGASGILTIEPWNGNGCKVTYPDNTSAIRTDVCSLPVASMCTDIYYNTRTKDIKRANIDYSSWFDGSHNNYDSDLHDYICGDDKANVEYFCTGDCKFPNNKSINCNKIDETISPSASICTDTGTLKSLRFIGYILYIAKITVPIILIITGTIDFGKATIASNHDAVSKSTKIFATRIISAIVVFLIPTIVNFVFNLVTPSESNYRNCETCIFNPSECNIYQ